MTIPGAAGDGLVRPLNSPQGQQALPGIQPGVSGGVVLAQYVIIFGAAGSAQSGGLFIYQGSPGPGNPPVFSISNATEDPYGNPIAPGIWAGPYGGTQAGLEYNGSYGQALFPVGGAAAALAGGIAGTAAVGTGGGSVLQIFSAQDASPLSDRVLIDYLDNIGGAGSARALGLYIDTTGAVHTMWSLDFGGLFLATVNNLTAVLPGTGTSLANVAQPETWHPATPLTGTWTGSGAGVNGLFYRFTPDNEVELIGDIINTTAIGNSTCFTLPAGYRPATAINLPAGWNNPAVNNSATVPWLNVANTGVIQVTGIEVINKEIFFRAKFPLGAL
jgi:hypothetical protein